MSNEIEIPNSIMDNLMSKNNEKRNQAGKEIEKIIQQISQENQIKKMIIYFSNSLKSTNINDKRGCIKALASIGSALKDHPYLKNIILFNLKIEQINKMQKNEKQKDSIQTLLITPLITQMQDNDSKIRFACLEGLYLITCALQDNIIVCINQIFETLVTKVTDMDQQPNIYLILQHKEVRQAAQTLDNQLKTIVQATDINNFNIKEFIELITKKLVAQNPIIKLMLLSWIKTLDSIPGVNMIQHLPTFLEQLFLNMSDQNREIRQSAELCLKGFLEEIVARSSTRDSQILLSLDKSDPEIKRETHEEILKVLIDIIKNPKQGEKSKYHNISQMNCIWWILSYLQLLDQNSSETEEYKTNKEDEMDNNDVPKNSAVEALLKNIDQIIEQTLYLLSNEQSYFVKLEDYLLFLSTRIIIQSCQNNLQEEIRRSAEKINQLMLKILEKTRDKKGNFNRAMPTLQRMLEEKRELTAQNALVWMKSLIKYYNKSKSTQINQVLSQLIAKLYDTNAMVESVMEVLGNILKDKENFDLVIGQILKACFQNQKILNKSDIIIKQLCSILNPELVFKTMASELRKYDDVNFVSPFIRSLDLILLTESDLKDLRQFFKNLQFQKNLGQDKIQLFYDMFRTWSYNPVSAITLCFLTQAYELAYSIILSFQEIELNKTNLTQICELIYLLEKPIFVYLRLQLLEHEKYPFLLKSLHGLMMLLPQGETYNLLSSRLKLVTQSGVDNQNRVQLPWEQEIINKIETQKMIDVYLTVQHNARQYQESMENLKKLQKQ